MANNDDKQRVKLLNVRGSFLHVHDPQEQKDDEGNITRKYNANFLIPKDAPETARNLKVIKAASMAAKTDKWGADRDKWPNIASHKVCMRDGDNPDHVDLKKRPEYAGHYFISCSSPEDRQPQVLTNRMDDDDDWIPARKGQKGSPYSGCWNNAVLRIWAQDNKHGKRINAALDIVQFRRDDTAFSQAAPVNAKDYLGQDDVSYDGDMDDEGGYGGDDLI